jgi:hypothetical protein
LSNRSVEVDVGIDRLGLEPDHQPLADQPDRRDLPSPGPLRRRGRCRKRRSWWRRPGPISPPGSLADGRDEAEPDNAHGGLRIIDEHVTPEFGPSGVTGTRGDRSGGGPLQPILGSHPSTGVGHPRRSVMSDPSVRAGARAHHDRRRAAGDSHNAALRNLANRLLGRLWWCLANQQPWDDQTAWPLTHTPREAAA